MDTLATPIPPSVRQRNEAIRAIVEAAGRPEPAETYDIKTELPPTSSKDGEIRYVNEKHDESVLNTEITHIGLNDAVIFPGALIKGNKVNDFVYPPITLPRAPMTISISAEGSVNTGQAITQVVQDPQKLSHSRQAIADMLKTAIGPDTRLAARAEFEKTEVHSEAQMLMAIGADVKYGVGSIKSDFSWNQSENLHHVVAKYRQVYFTVDVDTPQSPADLFDPDTDLSSLERAMPPGSMPLYIGSVSYGMMAIMFMESKHSAEEMKAALDAAYNGAVEVEAKFAVEHKEVLDSATYKVVVYGGSTLGLDAIEEGLDGFMKVIKASRTYSADSPGVPISYVFRNLQDNLLAAVNSTTSYSISTPIKLKQKVRVTIESMICTMSDDEGANNDADIDHWDISVAGVNVKKDGAAVPIPAQTIYHRSMPGGITVHVNEPWNDAFGKSGTIIFDTDPEIYDFEDHSQLIIKGYGRELDAGKNKNEEGHGELPLTGGSNMGGKHSFPIDSRDFRYSVTVQVDLL